MAAEGTIENLVVVGEVTTSADNAGGIVGTADGTILNCGNWAAVTATGNTMFLGGIAGMANADISDCFNVGAVSGYSNVGGIVGGTGGSLYNCYNFGAISGLPL